MIWEKNNSKQGADVGVTSGAVITINKKRNCFGHIARQNLGRQDRQN